ncbi:hypothetical protein AAVH_33686 [Aphelenchoides avenae]|nr:hypothetical protein AAVH_33686 [Aphelenchus avenae]
MLVFTVLATLLCSSLVDARKALVNTSAALEQCRSREPYCNNAALEITKATEFRPTINAAPLLKTSPPDRVNLSLAVKINQPLVFPMRVGSVWEITRPDDKCLWIISSLVGTVRFEERIPGKGSIRTLCDGEVGRDVDIAMRRTGSRYSVDFKGTCDNKPSSKELSAACNYAPPDSTSIPGWDVWTLSVSASNDTNKEASIMLKDAYVVYDEPEPTTTTHNGTFNGTTTSNITATTDNAGASTTQEVGYGATTFFAIVGVCGLFFALFVIAVIIIVILCIRQKRNKGRTQRTKEGPRKEDPKDVTATEDRHCIQTMTENTGLESTSKRMEDEKQVTAAATAQNPAPGEAPGEPKSQASQEVFNKGPAGTSNEPAADPTKIA